MIPESFSEGQSVIHRLDPRIKLVGALLLSLVVATADNAVQWVVSLTLGLIFAIIARLSFRALIARLIAVNGFIVFLWLMLPFSLPGDALWNLGPLVATREGIALTLAITCKANAIFLILTALPGTSTLVAMVHGLHHLHLPDKFVHLFAFMVRYLDVLVEEYSRLRSAMKIRAFTPRSDLHTYRSYGYLLAMLLVRSFERAERIHEAMVCRGFTGTYHMLDHFSPTKMDLPFLILFAALASGLALI